MKNRNPCDLLRDEHGASFVETALLLPLFALLLFFAVDFGRAFYMVTELAGAAHAAALYGSQNPSDTAGMTTAAQNAAPDVPGVSAGTPTYGCECAISKATYVANCPTASQPTCTSSNLVYRVNVTVTGTFSPLFPAWPGIPSSMSLSSSASMRSK